MTLIALVPTAFQIALLTASEAALAPDRVWLGFTQYDQPYYHASARELFERGNGLFHANPCALGADAPRIYTHFVTVLLGWSQRLSGLEPHHIDLAGRLIFGPLMLLLAVALMGQWIRHRPMAWGFAIAVAWGGGLGWLVGLGRAILTPFVGAVPPRDGWPFFWLWHDCWRDALGGHGGWGTSLARQVGSLPECLYHVLALGALLALARGRWAWAVVLTALTCWAHPFTGLFIGLVTPLFLASERLGRRRLPWIALAASLFILALFLLYNLAWLPRDAGHREVAERMRGLSSGLALWMILPAYGLFVFLPLLGLTHMRGFARALRFRRARLLSVWLAVVLGLVFNDHLLPLVGVRPFVPLHFTRGYLMLPLVILSGRALTVWARRRQWTSRHLGFVALAIGALSVPDMVETLRWPLRSGHVLTMSRGERELLDRLDDLPEQHGLAVVGNRGLLPLWLTVYTPHTGLRSHLHNTPNKQMRDALQRNLLDGNARWPDLAAVGIDGIIVAQQQAPRVAQQLNAPFRTVIETERWQVWLVESKP